MRELGVFVVYCTEGVAKFTFTISAPSVKAAISFVRQKRPRVTVLHTDPEPRYITRCFPKIHKMEEL